MSDGPASALLAGRTALIAGVGPGLGAQVAREHVAAGGSVAMAARSDDCGTSLVDELGDGSAMFRRCDITRTADCEAVVAAAVERFGGIDCLVVNAMASRTSTLVGGSIDTWREVMEVNLFGALEIARAAAPALVESPSGSIVFVGSQIVRRVFPGRGPYASSKAALITAGHALAAELGPLGVRVNTVVPGRMWGEPLQSAVSTLALERGRSEQEEIDSWVAATALKRLVTDVECARVVSFLNSSLATGVTGQTIDVNGGETMR